MSFPNFLDFEILKFISQPISQICFYFQLPFPGNEISISCFWFLQHQIVLTIWVPFLLKHLHLKMLHKPVGFGVPNFICKHILKFHVLFSLCMGKKVCQNFIFQSLCWNCHLQVQKWDFNLKSLHWKLSHAYLKSFSGKMCDLDLKSLGWKRNEDFKSLSRIFLFQNQFLKK